MSVTEQEIRLDFFRFIFGEQEGYLCIGTKSHLISDFQHKFFLWPQQSDDLLKYIDRQKQTKNVWFGVNLYSEQNREKNLCLPGNVVWADLDAYPPEEVVPTPQMVIETSPGKFQGIWRLDSVVDPSIAEDYSRTIYQRHKELPDGSKGVDSGWALTKLLRVPYTFNFKYTDKPLVELRSAKEVLISTSIFDDLAALPVDEDDAELLDSVPVLAELPDFEAVLYKYRTAINRSAFTGVFSYEPSESDDWSGTLWKLLTICFEVGMDAEEVFAVGLASKCNKYARDGRPLRYLWRDVKKAELSKKRFDITFQHIPLKMPRLVDEEELEGETFIDRYRAWATEATDAIPEYHNLSAFILLSALLAGNVKLDTSDGTVRPNIWGMILGDSTLTRKSTSMRMAMEFMTTVERELLLASDGSMEGILSGLQTRPSQVSVFFRDEVTGFFEGVKRKDYMSDIPTIFTQLYDVPPFYPRRLRKETITLVEPIFIFFGGGIKDKMYSLVDEGMVLSGFIPRFLFVSGETDITSLRRTGPLLPETGNKKEELSTYLRELYVTYNRDADVQFVQTQHTQPQVIEAILSTDAWNLYGDYEEKLNKSAFDSSMPHVAMPTFARMSRSMLKMAVLLAASRQLPHEGMISVTVGDLKHAASYIQRWGWHTIELLENLGRSVAEREMQRVLSYVSTHPGITRGEIMRSFRIRRREMAEIEGTLEDRGQLLVSRNGKAIRYTGL